MCFELKYVWFSASHCFCVVCVFTYTFFFSVRRKIVVAKQNYRCAGCGTRIDPGMTSSPRKIPLDYYYFFFFMFLVLRFLQVIIVLTYIRTCFHWNPVKTLNVCLHWQCTFCAQTHCLLFLPLPCLYIFCLFPNPDYIKRLRYCEYLGRYFCQCCHENAQAVVPGRVLRKWDFSKYYVSNFARDLLSKIAGDPLFNPNDINSGLYKKIKALEAVRVSTEAAGGWKISHYPDGCKFWLC